MRSSHGTPEQIESDILVEQLLARLTPEERMVCVWKELGFSSREIAKEQGTSVERVNTFFHRVKRKIRDALRTPDVNASSSPATPRTKARTA
jgi:DNA-directed RNA polymerase specialized sigma24 family protein